MRSVMTLRKNSNNLTELFNPTTMATNAELKYKILGFNDDFIDCEVCGKRELIYNERLAFAQRIERTRPLSEARDAKRREIITKYGLPEKTYI